MNPDIIALQEIQSDSNFNQLIIQLNSQESEYTWNGFRANSAAYDLNLAYIYNENVDVDHIYEIYYADNDWWAFPRPPLVMEATFSNKQFTIINNHYKASSDEESQNRRYQASLNLQYYIDSFLSNESVIVLGDLNDDIAEPESNNVFWNFISDSSQYIFVDMEIAQGNSDYWSRPSDYGSPNHWDHILITNELFTEFENEESFVQTLVLEDNIGWNNYHDFISDHRPVHLSLNIQSGCTDPEACNYNPDATIDDGSCEYEIALCYDAHLSITNVNIDTGTLDIYMINEVEVAGFEFNLQGITITNISGGTAEQYFDFVYFNENKIIGFSISGVSIPSGEDVLITVSFSNAEDEICFAPQDCSSGACTNVIADPYGNSVGSYWGACYTPSECDVALADVTGNGQINVLDLVQIANLVLELSTPAYPCAADYNQDGQVNILDLVQISNYILNP